MSELARRRRLIGIEFVTPPNLPPPKKRVAKEALEQLTRSSFLVLAVILARDEGPWNITFRDSGGSDKQFVPCRLGGSINFWDAIVLKDHPLRCRRGYVMA